MYCCMCMVLGVRESVVEAGHYDALLGCSVVSVYSVPISELFRVLGLRRLVMYHVSMVPMGALRVLSSRGII